MPVTPQVQLKVGEQVEGFKVQAVTPLESEFAVIYVLEHEKTGARVLHIHTNDEENLFSVSFPTPPTDDTGVPHILEHAVLSGSKRFPVRDPFFEMIKMSMATFINAMTGWDTTYYPVSSNVKKDLFNLAEVYFDAVFHPLLTKATFEREGHHLAPADKANPTGDLSISGIVYNEMKGAFSHPESMLHRKVSRALFPNTVYGKESGGDPQSIPDLTWEQLREFHTSYYCPSNAYFIFYGDIPTRDYLAFLAGKLEAFSNTGCAPAVAEQPRWSTPRHVEETYPVGADEALKEKTYLAIQWLVGDATDAEQDVLLYVLGLILFGNEGAPLKKALIESRLGQNIIYSGSMGIGLENTFRIGLKGSEPERLDAFKTLVFDELKKIAGTPLDAEKVAAAFQQTSYHFLEIQQHYPLHMMQNVLAGWRYGKDPTTFLHLRDTLDACRTKHQADPKLFNKMIGDLLLNNPHYVTAVLRPDPGMQQREDDGFAARMRELRKKFNDAEMQAIAQHAEELDAEAGRPNTADQLASLPQLSVRDLPAKPRHIPTSIESLPGGGTLLRNDVFTNGVNYLQLAIDIRDLPGPLWHVVPRYTEAISKYGAGKYTFEQMAHRVVSTTGGVGAWPALSTTVAAPDQHTWTMRFALKTLDGQMPQALDVLRDLLFSVNPRDKTRLKDVMNQALAGYRSHLVYDGSSTAGVHADRGMSAEGYGAHVMNGLPQLYAMEDLVKNFDGGADQVIAGIEAIRDFLLDPARFTVSFTGSNDAYQTLTDTLAAWMKDMKPRRPAGAALAYEPFTTQVREGLAGPVQVAYCVQTIHAPHISQPDDVFLGLGCRMLSMEHILSEVRFKGNAYGAWLNHNPLGSAIHFGSYRDPNIARTLKVFADTVDFLRQAQWTQVDVDRAIIAAAKDDERPIRPDDATGTALQRHLMGVTRAFREKRSAQRRTATPQKIKEMLLPVLEANMNTGAVCVMSSRQKLEEANKQLGDKALALQDVLRK